MPFFKKKKKHEVAHEEKIHKNRDSPKGSPKDSPRGSPRDSPRGSIAGDSKVTLATLDKVEGAGARSRTESTTSSHLLPENKVTEGVDVMISYSAKNRSAMTNLKGMTSRDSRWISL